MSVIQKIRDKYAGIVIAFIALSLIAFILMDAFTGRGRGGGGLFSNHNTIGKVNGRKIDKRDFDKQVDLAKKYYNMGSAPYDRVVNGVWDLKVENAIMQDEYEKTGIAFSNKELNNVLFGDNPPYWMRQFFTDPNTGQYNQQQAMTSFSQMKKQKDNPELAEFYEVYIQQQTVEQTMRVKYLSLLSNSVYVPKWLAEKQMADNNSISSISYVYVPYQSVPDADVKVTDDEIKSYVKKHEAQFRADEETRNVSYVSFDVVPSAEDSAVVLNQLAQYKNEFATTKDEKSFLDRVGSDMPFYDSYMGASRIQQGMKDSIIKAGVGAVYGPYIDGKEVVMAKFIGSKTWPDSAKVRHILIKTQDPQSGRVLKDDSTSKKLIDSIALAIKNGANFDSMAIKFSDDGSREKGGVIDYFPQGQMVPEFNDFAFDKKAGDKGVIKSVYGYHYIEVLGQKNFQPAYKIAYLAKAIAPSQNTVDAAMSEAQRFAASSRNEKAFNENAAKFKKTALQSPDIKKYDGSVGDLGENRTFVRWIYDNDKGDVSDAIDFRDKFVVALITNIQAKGVMNVAKARPVAEPILRNEKKAKKIIGDKFKGNTLEAYAQSSGAAISGADSLVFSSPVIPNVGLEPKMIGIAFNRSQVNKVTEPIAGANGVFGVLVKTISARPSGAAMADYRKSMEGQMRNSAYNSATTGLKKAASIKDYRYDFF